MHQFGLFPAHNLSADVLLAASASPLGMGVRNLTWQELGLLWDVPILCMDSLAQDKMEEFIAAVCVSAPAKVLFSGTDALLTTLFRGGLHREEEIPSWSTTCHEPATNDAIGLEVVAQGVTAVAPEKFEVASLVASLVVKGEVQKADGSLVPVQLWDRAFLRGYGKGGQNHLLRHQEELGLSSDKRAGFMNGSQPPDGWTAALGVFRTLGLAWWRRHVLRDFYAWRKANIGGVSSVGLVTHSTGVRHGKGVWFLRGRPLAGKHTPGSEINYGLQKTDRPQCMQALMPYSAVQTPRGLNERKGQSLFFGTGGKITSEVFGTDSHTTPQAPSPSTLPHKRSVGTQYSTS